MEKKYDNLWNIFGTLEIKFFAIFFNYLEEKN